MNRREFSKIALGSLASGLFFNLTPSYANATLPFQLSASRGKFKFRSEQKQGTDVMFYNESIPGPVIRIPQGKQSTIHFKNNLDQATSIHWHGLRIANAMDGVPGMTQKLIQPNESFDYTFTPPDAGTYWYHTHQRSWEQLALGLAGVLIVEETNPPKVDQDLIFAIDDWLMEQSLQIEKSSLGDLHDWSHGGRIGNFVTVNGVTNQAYPVAKGERVRFRMINTANSRTMSVRLNQKNASIIAIDGQPISPKALNDDLITLAPGQRTDVMIDMMDDPKHMSPIELVVGNDAYLVGHFKYAKQVKREQLLDSPIALALNPANKIKLPNSFTHIPLSLDGGAMGRMSSAMFKGKEMNMEELYQNKAVWALNGVAGLDDKPLFSVKRGTAISLDVVNNNRWLHGIHVHGHHFVDEREPDALRDTALYRQQDKGSLLMVADNPGKWLIHCHMIEHQAGGMVTWFEVT